jgi:hypothetical protein
MFHGLVAALVTARMFSAYFRVASARALPKALHEISVAPSMRRAKS